MSRFNRYQGMYVEPPHKSVEEYNNTFVQEGRAKKKEKILFDAKQAMSWGMPDRDSIGYTNEELVSIIRRLVQYIEAS